MIALVGLALSWWLLVVLALACSLDTGKFGIFRQTRIGRHGRRFPILKLRTMRDTVEETTTVTTSSDRRITRLGHLLRRSKLDELPQLLNVLAGHMSLVGPRPDVPGYADTLTGEDRIVLSIRPGVTGLATLCFRNEEELLATCRDPEAFNREVIFPAKVELNRRYIEAYRPFLDLKILLATVGWTDRVPLVDPDALSRLAEGTSSDALVALLDSPPPSAAS